MLSSYLIAQLYLAIVTLLIIDRSVKFQSCLKTVIAIDQCSYYWHCFFPYLLDPSTSTHYQKILTKARYNHFFSPLETIIFFSTSLSNVQFLRRRTLHPPAISYNTNTHHGQQLYQNKHKKQKKTFKFHPFFSKKKKKSEKIK